MNKQTKLIKNNYLQFDNINLWYDKCKGKEYYSNSPVGIKWKCNLTLSKRNYNYTVLKYVYMYKQRNPLIVVDEMHVTKIDVAS